METLLDLLNHMPRLGGREAVRFYNGYRSWRLSYEELYSRVAGFVDYLKQEKLNKGDRVLLWGENRIAWVTAFWGCLARGVQVVPIDARSSETLVKRIQAEVEARLLVYGEDVTAQAIALEKISFHELGKLPSLEHLDLSYIVPSDVVEIVYTSGTTGEPKGIVHRHSNVCANLRPFQTEIERYRWLARPFQPVRILDLLPLSHLYGQSLGIFIPRLLGGAAVFMSDLNPSAVIEAIRRERVSVLAAVPRLLRNLQNEIQRKFDVPVQPLKRTGISGIAEKWWRHRQVHSTLGWKFWSIVLGGAQLDRESEDFWHRLGILIVQGYGLTETSPVVTVNHPFDTRRGSIGKALKGQEVKIAADGEILVRGESVVQEYLGGAAEPARVSRSGWLHTGDLAEIDQNGRLYYKGRKKEVIVTSEGLNVYPTDVESVLNRFSEVTDSTVFGLRKNGEEVVHAALILKDTSAEVGTVIRRANQQLEPHQQIRSWSVWLEEDFPRTPSTMKVKRALVARRVAEDMKDRKSTPAEAGTSDLRVLLAQVSAKDSSELGEGLSLDEDLGLSSLEKVELLSRLQNRYAVELEEGRFTQLSTVGELESWLQEEREKADEVTSAKESPGITLVERFFSQSENLQGEKEPEAMPPLPRWTWVWVVRWVRILFHHLFILPYYRYHIQERVEGLQHLEGLQPPVIFAVNHGSHLDTAAIFSALPAFWRWRLAPAMGMEYFRAYFRPRGHPTKNRLIAAGQYVLATLVFNTYPLSQRMGGIRQTLKYTGAVIDRGFCPLVFPEGKRTPDGKMLPFRTGIGYMVTRLRVPVVPICLKGLFEIYSLHHDWPDPGPTLVRFGAPLLFEPNQDYEEVTRTIERTIRELKG